MYQLSEQMVQFLHGRPVIRGWNVPGRHSSQKVLLVSVALAVISKPGTRHPTWTSPHTKSRLEVLPLTIYSSGGSYTWTHGPCNSFVRHSVTAEQILSRVAPHVEDSYSLPMQDGATQKYEPIQSMYEPSSENETPD